jgi:hypothetical protein
MFCLLNYLYAYTEAPSKAEYVGLYRTATADLGNDAGGTGTAAAAAAEAEGPEARGCNSHPRGGNYPRSTPQSSVECYRNDSSSSR